jgi:hypothetical protein
MVGLLTPKDMKDINTDSISGRNDGAFQMLRGIIGAGE